ncbi:MAG: hypothetical protein IT438_04740 [Phycisphaerales bacterium]|nr:hypothetical protein [Phycisphaerales bacterium]
MRFSNSTRLALGALVTALCAGAAYGSGTPCEGAAVVSKGFLAVNVPCQGGETIPDDCASTSFHNIWYSFTAPAAGLYQIDTFGTPSGFDTVLNAFSACGNFDALRIDCNDDSDGDPNNTRASKITVSLSAGQTIKISLGGFGTGDCGEARLNITTAQPDCCQPWDNGDFDRRNAQTSQIGYGQDWREFGRLTADDFWLCEGNIYHINTIRGKLCTDSVVPKAQVLVFEDCDGTPGRLIAEADSVQSPTTQDSILGWECRIGSVTITETGGVTDNGFRIIEVTANFDRLWLKGGQYWVVILGYSGTADPDEQFFWGTSNNQVVRGRPGKFYDSDERTWTDIDEICCGCTDFNFCVLGEQCKILLDNGSLDTVFGSRSGPPTSMLPLPLAASSPSLQNGGRTADKVRTADNFVVPPCESARLCYIEAWVLTNCDRVRLDLYRGDCHLPQDQEPILSAESQCLTSYGQFPLDGRLLTLYKAEFYNWHEIDLEPGNYWLSAYALGDGRQNARGYFVSSHYCDRSCEINFDPGAIRGAPYDTLPWRAVSPARDFSFVVAIEPEAEFEDPGIPATGTTCAADLNRDGVVTLQDMFDYLNAFFAGCP